MSKMIHLGVKPRGGKTQGSGEVKQFLIDLTSRFSTGTLLVHNSTLSEHRPPSLASIAVFARLHSSGENYMARMKSTRTQASHTYSLSGRWARAGLAAVAPFLAACGDDSLSPPELSVAAVSISQSQFHFDALDLSAELEAEVTASDGSPISHGVAWHVVDTGIARVVGSQVTAVANGETLLIATVGAVTDTAEVSVSQNPAEVIASLQAIGFDALTADTTLSVTLADRNGHLVTNIQTRVEGSRGVVEVWEDGSGEFTITAVENGPDTLSVTGGDAGEILMTIPVRVMQRAVEMLVASVDTVRVLPTSVEIRARALDRLGMEMRGLPALTIEEDNPAVPGYPVGGDVGESHVSLVHAGRVTVSAAESDSVVGSVTIDVVPDEPEIYGFRAPPRIQPGDSVVVEGYRVGVLSGDGFSLGPAALALEGREDHKIALRVDFDSSACEGTIRPEFTAPIPARSSLSSTLAYDGVQVMAVGEMVSLDGGIGCFRPMEGRYALAYADLGFLERSMNQPEPYWGYEGWGTWYEGHIDPTSLVAFSVRDRSVQTAAGSPSLSGASLTSPAPTFLQTLETQPQTQSDRDLGRSIYTPPALFELTEPAAVGDRVSVPVEEGHRVTRGDREHLPGEIVAVVGSFAVAVADIDREEVESIGHVDLLVDELERFRADGHTVFATLFGVDPATIYPAEQIFVAAGGVGGITLGGAETVMMGAEMPHEYSDRTYVDGILEHELAHSYQAAAKRSGSPASDELGIYTGRWAIEGGANAAGLLLAEQGYFPNSHGWRFPFPSISIGRWFAAIPSVWDAAIPFTSLDGEGRWMGENFQSWKPMAVRWNFGYDSSSWLLLDWTVEIARRTGLSLVDAGAVVFGGSLESWYGVSEDGVARLPGMVNRIQALVPDWQPADEFLYGVLKQIRESGDGPNDRLTGGPDMNIAPTAMFVVGEGRGFDIEIDRYTWGWIALDVTEDGSAVEVSSESPEMRLMLLRVQ